MADKLFNPSEHLQRIQGKDYLPVRWRLVWFHQDTGPRAGYVTVELEHDRQAGFARYFTVAWNGDSEEWRPFQLKRGDLELELDVCGRVATGEGSETRADFPEYAEKAATKSLGRALAGLGYGTQFAPELDEKQRVVDSPAERRSAPAARPPQVTRPAEVVVEPTRLPATMGELRHLLKANGYDTTEKQDAYIRQECGLGVPVTKPEEFSAVFQHLLGDAARMN